MCKYKFRIHHWDEVLVLFSGNLASVLVRLANPSFSLFHRSGEGLP